MPRMSSSSSGTASAVSTRAWPRCSLWTLRHNPTIAPSFPSRDAAAGPLGELRVGARLEREDTEERVVGVEPNLDVVMAGRRFHARPADCDGRRVEHVVAAQYLQPALVDVDQDSVPHVVQRELP